MNDNVLKIIKSVFGDNVKESDVTHLCTIMSLASPKGYECRLNYSSTFMLTCKGEHHYISCDAFTPSSITCIDKDTMRGKLAIAREQKMSEHHAVILQSL